MELSYQPGEAAWARWKGEVDTVPRPREEVHELIAQKAMQGKVQVDAVPQGLAFMSDATHPHEYFGFGD